LRASTTYNFKVAAINNVGTSTFTAEFAISTTGASAPDPPTELKENLRSRTSSSLEL
jgi:hypothetical protein